MKKYMLAVMAAALLLSGCKKDNESMYVYVSEESVSLTAMPKLTETEQAEVSVTAAEETVRAEDVTDAQTGTENASAPEITEGAASAPENVLPESISLTVYELTLNAGQSKMPIVTMFPENAADKSELWTSSDESVAVVDGLGNITAVAEGECTVTVRAAADTDVFAEVKVTVAAGPQLTYIDGILVVNKTYALPPDYNPGVDSTAKAAFDRMREDAEAEGLNIYISSGFRSYEYQDGLYNRYVRRDGKAEADRYSARAGHSEHQTGLAFDLNSIDSSFADTAEGKWTAENCFKYGFIIRYPADKESVTGYKYEPWHIRYLGEDTAKAVYDSGLCLEEYLGITSEYAE